MIISLQISGLIRRVSIHLLIIAIICWVQCEQQEFIIDRRSHLFQNFNKHKREDEVDGQISPFK